MNNSNLRYQAGAGGSRARWFIDLFSILLVLVLAPAAQADDSVAPSEVKVVTATRIPVPVDKIPADFSTVSASELLGRDATNLRTALSLVPGVEAQPGGDAGPSNSVPSFWGLHEFDAFLLVEDGIPWGGAFNPAISTLDLNDVKDIEVMKGAAPVMYGATSFVGVVQLLHYPAGQAANNLNFALGSFGSYRGATSFVLPSLDSGKYMHSLAFSAEHLGFADKRETVNDGKLLYRGAADLGKGKLRIDADVALVNEVPPSPVVRMGTALNSFTPRNANFQPGDAKMSENRYHLALGYTEPISLGYWDTIASFAHSDIRDVRGFLRPDLFDNGSANADSQNQFQLINNIYADTHLLSHLSGNTSLIIGSELLYGIGRQRSLNGEYYVPLGGLTRAPRTTSLHVDETNSVADRRVFAGQYAQIDWTPDTRWDVIAGLRLNETFEHKDSTHIDGYDASMDTRDLHTRNILRLAGTAGASYQIWSQDGDKAVLFADYRNTFKPAVLDFGPDNTPGVLLPETAQSYEAGLKGALANGLLTYHTELFLQNFANLVVPNPLTGDLQNAARQRLQGVEFGGRYAVTPDLSLVGNLAYHDARFTKYVSVDDLGNPVDVAGKRLTLSPEILASGGIMYTPPDGFNANLVANYVGHRWLNEQNTAPAAAYVALDATLGYRMDRFGLTLNATNLTNRRPPVSASEFGSQSFYLLPARILWLKLDTSL